LDCVRVKQSSTVTTAAAKAEKPGHIVLATFKTRAGMKDSSPRFIKTAVFVAANNSGRCVACGRLDQLKNRLRIDQDATRRCGLVGRAENPLTIGADHYRTQFIGLRINGADELRSDADRSR